MAKNHESYCHNGQARAFAIGGIFSQSTLYYLSMADAAQSIKSIWATVVSPKPIQIRPWASYNLKISEKSTVIQTKLPNTAITHMTILANDRHIIAVFDTKEGLKQSLIGMSDWKKTQDEYKRRAEILKGKMHLAHKQLMNFLYEVTDVPALDEWAPIIWQTAISKGLLTEMSSFGDCIGAWRASTVQPDWATLVSSLLSSKKVLLTDKHTI